jgi:hypothetical protein
MPAVIVMLALAALGCGTVKNLASNVKSASVICERCQAGMTVGVGTPVNLRVDWKRCNDMDPDCDANQPPFAITATCEGSACKIEDTGGGHFELTPTEPGTTTVVVKLDDKLSRTERIGPFTAAVVDAIDMVCTFIRPGGDVEGETCPAAIPPGSDIYIELVARAGDRRLAAPIPRDVLVDNRPVYTDGQSVGGDWNCASSSLSSDPTVPTITRCHLVAARPGASYTLEARLPAHKLGARATIAVAKR